MAEKDITNFLRLESKDAVALESAFAATSEWARSDFSDTQIVGSDALHFSTDWEPPFKAVKRFSKEHPKVRFTLWGDAYVKHHWICKSVFEAGKSQDWVVSLVDDDFDQIFAEVYGQDHTSWKSNPRSPFSAMLQPAIS